MTTPWIKRMVFVACLSLLSSSAHAVPNIGLPPMNWQPPYPVPEFIDYSIPYAGFTAADPYGRPYIRYNPMIMRGYTPAIVAFLRAHEYGHVVLRTSNEASCDCWAAQQLAMSDAQLIPDILDYLLNVMGPSDGDATHGNGFRVAQIVRQCAGRAGAGGFPAQSTGSSARATGDSLVRLLGNEDWDAFGAMYDDSASAPSKEHLQEQWSSLIGQYGEYKRATASQVIVIGAYTLYTTKLVFDTGRVELECAIGEGGLREMSFVPTK